MSMFSVYTYFDYIIVAQQIKAPYPEEHPNKLFILDPSTLFRCPLCVRRCYSIVILLFSRSSIRST